MSTQLDKTLDTEQDRQRAIQELAAEHGLRWLDDYKPGSFGCHELLDRTHLAAENVERSVLQHPACAQNAEWFALAERAVTALNELYQRIGAEHSATS
jgi:hypothetical protein